MSENNEYTLVNNEMETKATEDPPNDSCKSEAKLMNQTDAALLDDEEMPTYISVSSMSKPDDSDSTNTKQRENLFHEEKDRSPSPYPSDDQAASSIYVLSSGEDDDQHAYNDEDDEDEYGDSDDMENLELDNEFDSEHPNTLKRLMDEEDDDEDDEDEEEDDDARQIHDDEDIDFIDNDKYKVDSVDVRSDDFILNKRLNNYEKQIKSKSLSLQDLKEYESINHDSRYSNRRHILKRNYLNIPQNPLYSIFNKKQPTKYHHVQSKVKLYIKSIKEQNKRSVDRYVKPQENGIHNTNISDNKNNEIEKAKLTMANKTIKDYAKKTIKELEVEEVCNRDKTIYNVAPIMLNGQDNKNSLESIHEESQNVIVPFESMQNKRDTTNTGDNNDYIIEQERVSTELYNVEPMDVVSDAETDSVCTLRIENIKSIRTMDDEMKCNNEPISDKVSEDYKTCCNTYEINSLTEQLNKKTIQYNNLLEAYQKQLLENLRVKEELDKLKKSLANYEKENEPREQKVASIQTDVADSVPDEYNNQMKPSHMKQSNNKISGNSVASTLSSIGEWNDSTCNLSISMKPPEPVKALPSDDSMPLTDSTPGKTTRPLSHAFLTSSRILQTLANITQGEKTKPESPLAQNTKKRVNDENVSMDPQTDDSYQNQPSSSKKRKIADILGPSSFLQSLKTSAESHSQLNESNMESKFKFDSINDSINEKIEPQENIKTSQSEAAENKMENVDEDNSEDNVKCFIYHENENSKDRSFLILAEESEKDKAEKGRIRECGPYLLGNVEVRMSEINGTINIWGKEVSQESVVETENEMDMSKIKNDKKHCWQKTSHTKFNGSNLVCSTSKKLKTPLRFDLSSAASNFSCPHTSSCNNTAKPSCSTDKTHAEDLLSPNAACICSCKVCDSSRLSKEWLQHKRVQDKLHSCCIHNIDIEQKNNCFLHKEKQRFSDNCNCNKERSNSKEHRRNLSKNLESNKHLHENIANSVTGDKESTCRYHTVCHHSHDSGENSQSNHKCKKEDCICELLTNTEGNESCSQHSPHVHEEEPLLIRKQSSETPETRRRRLSGRRVRGILMDFLRGCGDCYSPNVSSNSKGCASKKNFCLTNCSPQIKVTPCASPEPTCSNLEQSVGRCCHAYAQRIESQLEEFRIEMERVRSRSDAILNMLNMLHSMDMN